MPRLISLAAAASILAGALTQAAPLQAQPADITLDAAARADVIDGALRALNEGYVFPETAEKMAQAIRARQQRKEYDALTSGRQFALTLTQHLRDVSHDLHLGVNFIPPGTQEPIGPPPPGSERTMEERQRIMAGRRNFGFVRVERLAGNIGYVDLRAFLPPQMSGETATFSAATGSDRDRISQEQQYRIDLVSTSAPVDSIAKAHVLANLFQAQPDAPARREPTDVVVDLSPWEGQTVRLRFAVADNRGPLRAAVDNIRFERLPQ